MKVSLNVASLGKLEKSLSVLVKAIAESPDRIIDKLLDIGEQVAEEHVLTGVAADGNEDIYVEKITVRNAGKLSTIGDDVAYQEFGYGLVGHVNRNPAQPPEYEQGQRTEWIYVNETGKHWSHGMEAQMPMYRAGRAMREALPQVAKEAIGEAMISIAAQSGG